MRRDQDEVAELHRRFAPDLINDPIMRFFEHTCRDEADLKRCVADIHVNPLKHGLVERVCDWPWSSFHRYVELGDYTNEWGSVFDWYGDEFRDFE